MPRAKPSTNPILSCLTITSIVKPAEVKSYDGINVALKDSICRPSLGLLARTDRPAMNEGESRLPMKSSSPLLWSLENHQDHLTCLPSTTPWAGPLPSGPSHRPFTTLLLCLKIHVLVAGHCGEAIWIVPEKLAGLWADAPPSGS